MKITQLNLILVYIRMAIDLCLFSCELESFIGYHYKGILSELAVMYRVNH